MGVTKMSLNSLADDVIYADARLKAPAPGNADQALDALTHFIPTEMLAPYVTALSLNWNAPSVDIGFIIATPFASILFYFAKIALANKPWPDRKGIALLVWKAIAALIAFVAWQFAVPTNTWQAAIGGAAVAGFLAIVTSPILTAIDAIVSRLINESPL